MAQLKETTIQGNLYLKGEGVKIYVNDTEFQGGGGSGDTNVQSDWNENTETSDAFIKNKPYLERGSGKYAIQQNGSKSIGESTTAFGKDNISGCKGYYIKSIDTTNKKIYLCNEKVVPVITSDDNTDTTFQTPLYESGMLFTIINGSHYIMCNAISQVSNNCVTYVGDLPFTDIVEDDRIDAYSFTVPMQPEIGNVLQSSAISFGENNRAIGKDSFVFGYGNIAFSELAHVEGYENIAKGWVAHSEGAFTSAIGHQSHAEGTGTKANGSNSHAECSYTNANGNASHSEGEQTNANGDYSHAEGMITNANGNASHSEGAGTKAIGYASHSEGDSTTANKAGAHAEGITTTANGVASHAEGSTTVADKDYSHAEGYRTNALASYSHSEGEKTNARGNASHSEGLVTNANGNYSHAEGAGSGAFGYASHSEGELTKANGDNSHAEGGQTIANGYASHAEGIMTTAGSSWQHVQGKFNKIDTASKYAHILGNGTDSTDEFRSNAHTVSWKGQGYFAQGTTMTGADYAEYFEWQDGNLNEEDRIGLLVTLDGDKIRLANADDEVLGIISGTAAVLGDNYECEWNGKYLTDDFGRIIYEDVEEFVEIVVGIDEETNEPITEKKFVGIFKHPKLNPNYDPTKEYVNRSDRPEWSAVGMIGKLYVRDDGSCIPNFYATVDVNGVATSSLEKTNMRVLSRVNDNVVRVLLK